MKAISMKAPASLSIAKVAQKMAATVSNHAEALAVISGAASFIGTLTGKDLFAGVMAMIFLGMLWIINRGKDAE